MKRIMKNVFARRFTAIFMAAVLVAGMLTAGLIPAQKAQAAAISSTSFLKANGKQLRNNYGNGDVVTLRGTNAGGYLLQEFWMCPTSYSTGTYTVNCEMDIYKTLTSRFGEAKMRDLIKVYQDNYWTTQDFDNCQALGINCIRLPMWFMNFVDFNGNYISNAFDRIDWFLQEAGKRGIYVILDMHGAPGSQNGSDHSGIDGGNSKVTASQFFFGNNANSNQQKYYDLWYKIAQRYKDNPVVAGYDLLNEPYCTYRYNSGYSDDYLHSLLWGIYNNAYNVIRSVDTNHVVIMEATWNPSDLPNPSDYNWSNVMYEYHNYLYDDYDNAAGKQITNMQDKLSLISSKNYNVPSYMGEFSYFNSVSAWQQGLQLLNDAGINWTTWTYKVTGSNNNWGLYNQNVSVTNVATDSEASIRSKWAQVGSSTINSNLVNGIKSYFTANPSPSTIPTGDCYFVANANSKVVCADNTGNDPLIANRNANGGAWETFNIVANGDGTYSFLSRANNKYVCAVIDESSQLLARSASISTWEKFYITKTASGAYNIKAYANNLYVMADLNNNGVLKAVTATPSTWESFNILK